MLDHAAGGMTGQQRVLGKPHPRCGTVAESFLGNERRAKLAPLRDRKVPCGLPVDDDGPGVLRQPLPRQSGKKFVLAVAGDTGDAQDFATPELEGNVLQAARRGDRPARG